MAPSPIAEAFVRLRPDLTGFRQELQRKLETEVAAVKAPTVRVRAVQQQATAAVGATVGAIDTSALRAASEAGAASVARQVQSTDALTVADTQLARATALAAKAQETLNAVDEAGIGAANALGVATREASASKTALNAATRASVAAQKTENDALIASTATLQANAVARREAALASLSQARTDVAQGARLKETTSGLIAQTAALTGIRGAALATSGPFIAGIAAVTAFAASLKSFATLEQTLDVFQATTGATADEMERVSAAAKELGADVNLPAVSAADAANAISGLARAGLSVEESIDGARGVLQLATAANIDFAASTEIVAGALNAFEKDGSEAVHVADLLANAANLAQGEITDFGQAFAQVEAVAHQFGVTLEDTTALLTLLARSGLRGSDAGTSLRTAILRLGAPTKQASELIKNLGLQIRDTQGNVRPEVFAEFVDATNELGSATQDALAAEIFGQDAIRAAILAGQAGVDGLDRIREAEERSGTAADVAAARAKGLAGHLGALKSNAETTAASLGGKLAPAAGGLIGFFDDLLTVTNETAEALGKASDAAGDFFDKLNDETGLGPVDDFFTGFLDDISGLDATPIALLADQFDKLQKLINGTDLGTASQDIQEFARNMQPAFTALNQLRAGGADDAVGPDRLATLAQTLRANLNRLSALGPDAEDAVRKPFQDAVDAAVAELQQLGPKGQAVINAQGPQLTAALDAQIRAAAASFTGISDIAKNQVPADLAAMIDDLIALGPPGEARLRQIGRELSQSLAEGIDDGNGDAVASARRAVADAIAAAQKQVQDSVRSAKGNLESLSSALGNQLQQIVEANALPAQQQLDKLTDSLERLQEQAERRRIRFDLRDARRDLADAQQSIQHLGTADSPEQQRARNEFLDPFIEKVGDAESRAKEFNLENLVEQQEDIRDAAVKTAQDGIAVLVDQFENGKITAEQFTAALNQQLGPAIAALPKANLGFSFTRDFRRNLNTIVQQAKDLAGFLGTGGTTPGPQSENVGAAAAAAQRRVTDAQANLQKQIQNGAETAQNTREAKLLLQQINRKLSGARVGKVGANETGSRNPRVSGRDDLSGVSVILIPTNK